MNKKTIFLTIISLMWMNMISFAQQTWKGTWATAVEWTGMGDMPKQSLDNRSCRQVVHVSFGGKELRLKLSNEFGKYPVEIQSVYIADTDTQQQCYINGKTVKYLKFNGKKNVIIEVKATAETPVVAVLGNSITDGRGSTTNHQNRWTDFFAKNLNVQAPHGVLNLGIGGNCVVQGGLSQPAMKRFDRDILGQTGVTHLIIFEGTNDIGGSKRNYEQVADTLIACYKVLISKAKAKGIKVYGGTITPTKGNSYFTYWHEAVRQTVNEWIRNSKCFDGVIDFDQLVCDPQDPQRLKPEFSDDWLHLNPKGYEAMGRYASEFFYAKN